MKKQDIKVGDIVIVIYPVSKESPVKKGDRVKIIEKREPNNTMHVQTQKEKMYFLFADRLDFLDVTKRTYSNWCTCEYNHSIIKGLCACCKKPRWKSNN